MFIRERIAEMLGRKPSELPDWAEPINQSYRILMWQLGEQERYGGDDQAKRAELTGLVHRRVLNLRESVLLTHAIPNGLLARSLSSHPLVFNNSEAALRVIPNSEITFVFDEIMFEIGAGQVVSPMSWCADRGLVRGVADGCLSDLPPWVKRQIQQPQTSDA
ncbi:MAG: hypothetical protein HYV40_00610 [Candidatus Levybacteria bacterium]|nr:hypothetical protein [Candidatus Levybacteria bacterium]